LKREGPGNEVVCLSVSERYLKKTNYGFSIMMDKDSAMKTKRPQAKREWKQTEGVSCPIAKTVSNNFARENFFSNFMCGEPLLNMV
jgi:hypothetical protein